MWACTWEGYVCDPGSGKGIVGKGKGCYTLIQGVTAPLNCRVSSAAWHALLCNVRDIANGPSVTVIVTVMVQFIIKIAAANATADEKSALDCPPSYDQVQVDYFNSLCWLQQNVTWNTGLARRTLPTTTTWFKWTDGSCALFTALSFQIFSDGHIPTTETNKLLHIVDGPMTQKILDDETTTFGTLWTVEELWLRHATGLWARPVIR